VTLGASAVALAAGAAYLKLYDRHNLVESSVRFCRSIKTAGQVAFDYKWSLRGYTEPEVRAKLVSEVRQEIANCAPVNSVLFHWGFRSTRGQPRSFLSCLRNKVECMLKQASI